jgi:type VI secretion system protein ImpM
VTREAGLSAGAADAPGWYGKLSSLGDFASRRLSPEWVRHCDDWLARSVAASHQVLGSRWLEVYLAAPVWRFAWAPTVVDAHWWFGVMMPSCDNVGRYFPLLVAQRRDRPPTDRVGFDHLDLWWATVARAALQTLGEPSTVDGFEAELQQAPPWPSAGPVMVPQQRQATPVHERFAVARNASLGQLLHGLAISELHGRLAGCSFWWPMSDAHREASFSTARGLPEPQRFADLLTGAF